MSNNEELQTKKTGLSTPETKFAFCKTEAGLQQFAIKWSPQDEAKVFTSRNQYGGTKVLSRSVPRRNRNIVRYKINRSLDFDIGHSMNENMMKSRNSEDNSPIDKRLSRSARIMRSLNINYSPFDIRTRKINKTLNFDSSPSPNKASSTGSPYNIDSISFNSEMNTLNKINKTLNFDSSSIDSNVSSSVLGSSIDSIDENQNQTPSQRTRNVKKSLKYLTPSSIMNAKSPELVRNSPMTRSERIINIGHTLVTPNFRSLQNKKMKFVEEVNASTPRNLLDDFETDENDVRPSTPENMVQFVPESMSGIKKSHKKERLSRRSERSIVHQTQLESNRIQSFTEDPIILSQSDERPTTPISNDSYPSPNYGRNSIKQSHKKDKSKKKSLVNYSEDEISDSGSIFDYSEIQEYKSISESDVSSNLECNSSPQFSAGSDFKPISLKTFRNTNVNKKRTLINNSVEDFSDDQSISDYMKKPDEEKSEIQGEREHLPGISNLSETSEQLNFDKEVKDSLCFDAGKKLGSSKVTLPVKPNCGMSCDQNTTQQSNDESIEENANRPATPENHINFIEGIMTDSIKKSHKKIKDMNKKSLFRPKMLLHATETKSQLKRIPKKNYIRDNTDILDAQDQGNETSTIGNGCQSPKNFNRAITPDNVNSSRLLLAHYSSVKKSHKKDKHKKIASEYSRRKTYFDTENESTSVELNTQNDSVDFFWGSCNKNDSTSSPDDSLLKKTGSNKRKSNLDESSDNGSMYDCEMNPQTPDKVYKGGRIDIESSTKSSLPLDITTPNKRKKSFSLIDCTTSNSTSLVVSNIKSISSTDYKSAMEEFMIFTPIKKKKALFGSSTVSDTISVFELTANDSKPITIPSEIETSCRCVTPTTSQNQGSIDNDFTTPNASCGVIAAIDENLTSESNNQENVSENSTGPSTPRNRSTSELIFNIDSIKKSHKKDKRINRLRRSLIDTDDQNYTDIFEQSTAYTTGNSRNSSFDGNVHDLETSGGTDSFAGSKSFESINFDNPQPSTSYGNTSAVRMTRSPKEEAIEIRTPPNCLKTISYLKLRQTDSIKRSHKKNRDKKRLQSLTIQDPYSSDDGSIFDENEKTRTSSSGFDIQMENEDLGNIEILGSNDYALGDINVISTDESMIKTPPKRLKSIIKTDSIKKSHKKVRKLKRLSSININDDLSDDGSIFDPDEKINEPIDDSNGQQAGGETSSSCSSPMRRTPHPKPEQ